MNLLTAEELATNERSTAQGYVTRAIYDAATSPTRPPHITIPAHTWRKLGHAFRTHLTLPPYFVEVAPADNLPDDADPDIKIGWVSGNANGFGEAAQPDLRRIKDELSRCSRQRTSEHHVR